MEVGILRIYGECKLLEPRPVIVWQGSKKEWELKVVSFLLCVRDRDLVESFQILHVSVSPFF